MVLTDHMRQWRERRNVTVEEAASRAGMTKGAWSKIERGINKPDIESLVRLQQVFVEYTLEDLARMAGYELPPLSTNDVDRLRRIENFLSKDPRYVVALEALMQFSPQERETILLMIESMEKSYSMQQESPET